MYSTNLSLSLSFKPRKQQEMLMMETQTYFAQNNCNADLKAQAEKVSLSVTPSPPKNKVTIVSRKCSAASQPPLTNTEITALHRKKERQEIYERVVRQCRREEEQKE
jgi:hypothetical protein